MSRVYDNWERLVGAVLEREELRRLALCESISSSISADFSSRLSFDSALENVSAAPQDSRNLSKMFDPADPSNQSIFISRNVMAIKFKEIKKATKNFRSDMFLGEGGFGPVFKGSIHEHYLTAVKPRSGIAVAIKMLRKESFQGDAEWSNEINYLSQLHHPNLIKLIGYCFEEGNRILVYEFAPKGSLDNHLFKRGHQSLSWATRIKVAIGVARTLAFLHDLAIPVIHRGVKSAGILLDGEFNAKLSGFSLAREGPTGEMTHVSTRVMGTYGYAAPEYVATGRLTTKCDVYSFGVVLLELLSGFRVVDRNRPPEQQNLVDWAHAYLVSKRRLLQIMDTRLEGQYPHKDAYKVAMLAYQCISSYPEERPRMAEVVDALERL